MIFFYFTYDIITDVVKLFLKIVLLFLALAALFAWFIESKPTINDCEYPYAMIGARYLLKDGCIPKAILEFCPNKSDADVIISGRNCTYNSCPKRASRMATILVTRDFVVTFPLLKKLNEHDFATTIDYGKNVSIMEARVETCMLEANAPMIVSNILRNVTEPFNVCCGPICMDLQEGDLLPGITKYCSRLSATGSKTGIKHILVNSHPTSCEEIDCVFCKDFLLKLSCGDTFSFVFWSFMSSLLGLLTGLLLWFKFMLAKRVIKHYKSKGTKRRQGSIDLKTVASSAALYTLIGTSEACMRTLTPMKTSTGMSSVSFSANLGDVICFNVNDILYELVLDSIEAHHPLVYRYHTAIDDFKIENQLPSPWTKEGCWENWIEETRSYDYKKFMKYCVQSTILHNFGHQLLPVDVFPVFQVTPAQPMFKFQITSSVNREPKIMVLQVSYPERNSEFELSYSGESIMDPEVYTYEHKGSYQIINSDRVNRLGSMDEFLFGSIQCLRSSEDSNFTCKSSNKHFPQLGIPYDCSRLFTGDNCHETISITKLSDCEPICNGFKLERLPTFMRSEYIGNKNFQFHLEIPKGEIKYNSEDCEVKSVRMSGLTEQNGGVMLTVVSDEDSSPILDLMGSEIQCTTHKSTCSKLITLTNCPEQIGWICGDKRGKSKVDCKTKKGVDTTQFTGLQISNPQHGFEPLRLDGSLINFLGAFSWPFSTVAIAVLAVIVVIRKL